MRSPTRRPARETQALLGLAGSIRNQGVPLILTDHKGNVAGHANLPFETKADTVPNDDPRVAAYIDMSAEAASADRRLADRQDLLRRSAGGERRSASSRCCRSSPRLILLIAGATSFARGTTPRASGSGPAWRASRRISSERRSRAWAAGSSCMEERATDDTSHAAVSHMRGDLERLDRVAHRFERIGREPKFEPVDVGGDRRAHRRRTFRRAFRRSPTRSPSSPRSRRAFRASFTAIPCLLEWAVEVLTKNAIDALAGRGGRFAVGAAASRDDSVVISRRRRRPGRSARAARAHLRARLLDEEERLGHRPLAREAHRRGESRRQTGARADGAGSDVRDYSSLMSTLLEEKLTAGLNPAQREAVLHVERPAARACRRRIGKNARADDAHRATDRRRGRRPAPILAVTFTNKAAGEMRERIGRILGADPAGCGSARSTRSARGCFAPPRISFGARRRFTIYDQDDSLGVIKRLMERHNISPKQFTPRGIQSVDLRREERAGDAERIRAAGDGSVLEGRRAGLSLARRSAAVGERRGLRRSARAARADAPAPSRQARAAIAIAFATSSSTSIRTPTARSTS